MIGIMFMFGLEWVYALLPGFYPAILSFDKYMTFPSTLYIVIIAAVAVLIGYLVSGFISDIIGRKKTITLFFLIVMILSILLIRIIILRSGFITTAIIAGVLAFFTAGIYGIVPSFLSEKTSTDIRNTAIEISFNIATIGNFGVSILLLISKISSTNFYIAWGIFIMIGEILMLLSAILSKETKNLDIRRI